MSAAQRTEISGMLRDEWSGTAERGRAAPGLEAGDIQRQPSL